MIKTNSLKKLIYNMLLELGCDTYFEIASKNATFPYVVYDLQSVGFNSGSDRNDVILEVNLYDNKDNSSGIDDIADRIEKLFNCTNKPVLGIIYPTFHVENRMNLSDPDRLIRRRLLRIAIQNYDGKE